MYCDDPARPSGFSPPLLPVTGRLRVGRRVWRRVWRPCNARIKWEGLRSPNERFAGRFVDSTRKIALRAALGSSCPGD